MGRLFIERVPEGIYLIFLFSCASPNLNFPRSSLVSNVCIGSLCFETLRVNFVSSSLCKLQGMEQP